MRKSMRATVIKRARYNKRDTISKINVTTAFINNQAIRYSYASSRERNNKKKKEVNEETEGKKAFQPYTPQKLRHCNAKTELKEEKKSTSILFLYSNGSIVSYSL